VRFNRGKYGTGAYFSRKYVLRAAIAAMEELPSKKLWVVEKFAN
jgi:hypothetical protein